MTCREKFAILRPDLVDDDLHCGGCAGCPHDNLAYVEILPKPDYCKYDEEICKRCWNREIPGTENTVIGEFSDLEVEIYQPCILCGGSIPCCGPMICDSCRDLWKKLKEENT